MFVFLASGLWHGANWSYVIWGGLNGLYQVVGNILKPVRNKLNTTLHLERNCLSHKILCVGTTFLLIDFSWIFFRASSFRSALHIAKSIFTANNPWILFDGSLYQCGLNQKNFTLMLFCIFLLLLTDICKYKGINIPSYLLKQKCWIRWLIIPISICLILLFGIWGTGYNETNFIYFQF